MPCFAQQTHVGLISVAQLNGWQTTYGCTPLPNHLNIPAWRRQTCQLTTEISLSIKFVFLFTVFLRKHLSLSPSSLEKSISIKYILYFVVLTLQINYKSIHHLYLCFSLPYNNREIKLHSALQWANYTMSIKTSGSNLTNSIDNHSHS